MKSIVSDWPSFKVFARAHTTNSVNLLKLIKMTFLKKKKYLSFFFFLSILALLGLVWVQFSSTVNVKCYVITQTKNFKFYFWHFHYRPATHKITELLNRNQTSIKHKQRSTGGCWTIKKQTKMKNRRIKKKPIEGRKKWQNLHLQSPNLVLWIQNMWKAKLRSNSQRFFSLILFAFISRYEVQFRYQFYIVTKLIDMNAAQFENIMKTE